MSDPKCKDLVRSHYNGRMQDIRILWEDYKNGGEGTEDLGSWNEYGLCFDYCPVGTFTDQKRGFFRYQISTGGPGDEFRFYCDETLNPYKIEYWYLDWFDGAKITLQGRNKELLMEIWQDWKECEVPQNAIKEAS